MKSLIYLFICAFMLAGCAESDETGVTGGDTGVGGSLARFTIVGDFLYTVDFTTLKVFDITDPGLPVRKEAVDVGFGVETIFPLGNRLFLGMQDGMAIFDIRADGIPEFVSVYRHIQSCDPVVADSQYAYVTLRATGCSRAEPLAADVLEVISIADPSQPQILASYPLSQPRGLGLDGELLFVCDSEAGLRVYDVTNPINLVELFHVDDIIAYDVIPLGGLLLVVGPENVYQYDYSQPGQMVRISELPLKA